MGDYLPKFKPGDSHTPTASATIVGGQMLVVTGNRTVGPSAGVDAKWVGVAAHDTVSGEPITVFTGGVQRPLASGTVTAGDLVTTAAAGRVITLAAVTTPTAADVTNTRAIVGLALSTATDGNAVLVAFDR